MMTDVKTAILQVTCNFMFQPQMAIENLQFRSAAFCHSGFYLTQTITYMATLPKYVDINPFVLFKCLWTLYYECSYTYCCNNSFYSY